MRGLQHTGSGKVAASDLEVKNFVAHLSNYKDSTLYTWGEEYISNE